MILFQGPTEKKKERENPNSPLSFFLTEFGETFLVKIARTVSNKQAHTLYSYIIS